MAPESDYSLRPYADLVRLDQPLATLLKTIKVPYYGELLWLYAGYTLS